MTISSNAADGRPAKQETQIATKLAYLSHVDGLRCVAVLSVILFHLDFALFSGGWVGVDVFFVISGFLITRLIAESVERGSFSFGDFYTRRARRVFPALIFTIAVSFLVGCLTFDPIYRQHFAGEVVYALAAVPNLFYWRDGSYFGVAESFKPLLHTWSLGVEEQFYLVWPLALTLLLGLRRVMLWSVLLGAFFISISAADFYYHAGSENAVFFLLPTRIFEFTIGALTVWIVDHRVPERVREGSMLCGLGLVAYAVFGFTPSTPFPSFYALIPCVGTALAIVGGSARRLAQLLSNPPVVWVGKISYSLYLAHWPIIVFYRYHRLMPLSLTEKASLLVATVAIAQLMYSYVETPFRNPVRIRFASKAAFALACCAALITVMVPASIVWAKGSLFWRDSVTTMSDWQLAQIEDQQEWIRTNERLAAGTFASEKGRTRLLFVGDSHSLDIGAAMLLALGSDQFAFARIELAPTCFRLSNARALIQLIAGSVSSCERQRAALRKSQALANADAVFIANYWTSAGIDSVPQGLALLRSVTHAKLLLVGQNAIFPTFDGSLRFLGASRLASLNSVMFAQRSLPDLLIDEKLRLLAAAEGVGFVDRQPLICSVLTAQCHILHEDGSLLYRDRSHWSSRGRRYFGDLIATANKDLFAPPAGHGDVAPNALSP